MVQLRDVPHFSTLTDAQLRDLESFAEVLSYPAGDTIFRQGDPPSYVYIVQRGRIRVFAVNEGVAETYTVLEPGDVLGEIGVLQFQDRTASAETVEDTTVYRFEGGRFRNFLETCPTLASLVSRTMVGRFQNDARRAERRRQRALRPEASLVSVFSATGGSGRSLIAANLARNLAEIAHHRVLAVDLDLMFGDLGTHLGVVTGPSLSEILMEPKLDLDTLLYAIQTGGSGVDVLRAPQRPEQAEFVQTDMIHNLLDTVCKEYDILVCDTSNQLNDLSLDLYEMSTHPILVVTPELTCVKNAVRWLDLVTRIGLGIERLRIVWNKVEAGSKPSIDFLREHYPGIPSDQLVYDRKTARACLNSGRSLEEENPGGELARSVQALAGKFVGIEVDAQTIPRGRWGWL